MKRHIIFALTVLTILPVCAHGQDVKLPEKPDRKGYVHLSDKDKGFWCSAGISGGASFLSKNDSNILLTIGADVVAGYRFNEFIRIGLGVSPQWVAKAAEIGLQNSVAVPIYFDARGNFLPQKHRMFSPYWGAELGYTIGYNGIYASPTLGLKFGELRNTFLLGIFYSLQQQTVSPNFGAIVNSIGIKLAYEF